MSVANSMPPEVSTRMDGVTDISKSQEPLVLWTLDNQRKVTKSGQKGDMNDFLTWQ